MKVDNCAPPVNHALNSDTLHCIVLGGDMVAVNTAVEYSLQGISIYFSRYLNAWKCGIKQLSIKLKMLYS